MNTELQTVLTQLGIDAQAFEARVAQLIGPERRRYTRLWAYYHNPMRDIAPRSHSDRPYRQAQEWGLPARLTGQLAASDPLADGTPAEPQRKDLVIENDIAWRVDTMVEYLFGRSPLIQSLHPDASRRPGVEAILHAIFECNGGTQFLQQLALLGAIYGHVDIAVTLDTQALELLRASGSMTGENPGNLSEDAAGGNPEPLARLVSLQLIEPARALPLLDAQDLTHVLAYAQVYDLPPQAMAGQGTLRKAITALTGVSASPERIVELWSDHAWWRWRSGMLEASGINSLGRLPVVHIQNTAMPFAYSGVSDVEPLLPLQDELNTRLSDRAHRIAMQSFKMYLGVGVTDLDAKPPAPGRYWESGNEEAHIQEIGGDANCAAEETHIAEVREAMDRASGVPPVAAGAIRNRIGNLTSAAALRITMMSLLARTERKRALYGRGLEQLCEVALAWLDLAGLFHTSPEERRVELQWPSALPENEAEKLEEARLKLQLGIGKEVVLKELGY